MPELNSNLIKTIYFYLVMVGCVLALSIGSYWFIRSNLIKYVFPDAEYSYYGVDLNRKLGFYDCQSYLGLTYNPEPGTKDDMPILTKEQETECKAMIEKEQQIQKERRYQNDMLSSILMLVVAGVVLTLHLKWVRVR